MGDVRLAGRAALPALNHLLYFRHVVKILGNRCSYPAASDCGGGGTRPPLSSPGRVRAQAGARLMVPLAP